MISKLLIAVIAMTLGVVVTGGGVRAAESGSLRHAYRPAALRSGTQQGWMQARVNNYVAAPQSKLVCVEAYRVGTKAKQHLGCLSIDLAAYQSMDRSWAMEFNAPTHWLRPGTYRVVYTYQGMDNRWYRVLSTQLQVQDGWYSS